MTSTFIFLAGAAFGLLLGAFVLGVADAAKARRTELMQRRARDEIVEIIMHTHRSRHRDRNEAERN